eukprot:Gregarina_sp_Poly_1__796@NODE_118_length_13642_cov_140_527956_g105_i0_p11_GENE_NODE_118_length_13642_cov_140_527956_g105_i0NODE_118_length_13642_cov_140_527956_g105_i0_p11_ORF_typecomplete_len130_score3_23_NODE_118_length_13642_cov_140_527956_g105_i01200012389
MDTTSSDKLSDPFGFTGSSHTTIAPKLHDPFVGSWDPIISDESLSTLASTTRFGGQGSTLSIDEYSPAQPHERRTDLAGDWRARTNHQSLWREQPSTPSSVRNTGLLGSAYSPQRHDVRLRRLSRRHLF